MTSILKKYWWLIILTIAVLILKFFPDRLPFLEKIELAQSFKQDYSQPTAADSESSPGNFSQSAVENSGNTSKVSNLDNDLFDNTAIFACYSWPFEGVPYFQVKVDTISLRERPSWDSFPSKTVKINKGSIISFPFGVAELIRHQKEGTSLSPGKEINTTAILDKSIQVTVSPGIITATQSGIFTADASYGKIKSCSEIDNSKAKHNKEYSFKKDDVVENLLYLGEGECLFRYKDEIFVHHGCLFDTVGLQKVSEPETEWWVSFKLENQHVGWLKMGEHDNTIELIDTVK